MQARASEQALKTGCSVLEKAKKEMSGIAMASEYVKKLRGFLVSLEKVWGRSQSMLRFRRVTAEWIDHEQRMQEIVV